MALGASYAARANWCLFCNSALFYRNWIWITTGLSPWMSLWIIAQRWVTRMIPKWRKLRSPLRLSPQNEDIRNSLAVFDEMWWWRTPWTTPAHSRNSIPYFCARYSSAPTLHSSSCRTSHLERNDGHRTHSSFSGCWVTSKLLLKSIRSETDQRRMWPATGGAP